MELYIHIPFCRKKCRYCSFSSYVGQEAFFEEYINLILIEAEARKNEIQEPLQTAYIGGGTPSLLPPHLLCRLISGLQNIFEFGHVEEFTSEANPGTVTQEWLDAAVGLGINRLSFGMQTYQDHLLRILGRIHHFDEVDRSFRLARISGIENLSLDLMFGIPQQSCNDWIETLNEAVALHPHHISAYGLIPEEGTPLFRDLATGTLQLPDPEEERRMYDDAITFLSRHGFRQYEISNFALKGHECRHNIGYWSQIPYVGLGVSAASMTDVSSDQYGMTYTRRTNPETLSDYSTMVRENRSVHVHETISPQEARFETMMLGLRMNRGISETQFYKMHGRTLLSCYGKKLCELEKQGLLIHAEGCWKLSRRGFDIQNSILVEFMD